VVKLAASMLACLRAARHSSELHANATMVTNVRATKRAYDISFLSAAHCSLPPEQSEWERCLVRQCFELHLSISFRKTIRFLALSNKPKHPGTSQPSEYFLFSHMVVAEGQCAARLQYPVKLS
jgi:hypothetical protein